MNNQLQRIIAELVDSHQFTYEKLGELADVGKSTVRKWRYGMIANPSIVKISKLAKGLNRPITDFIDVDKSNNDYQTGPFGERLVRIMIERGLDEEELAGIIKMPIGAVQELTAESEPPSEDVLYKLSAALLVDTPWFRGETIAPFFYVDNDEYTILSGYRHASDDTRRAVRAIISVK